MQQTKVYLLRGLFIALCAVASLLIFVALPVFAGEQALAFPELAGWRWPLTVYLWITSIPFYLAAWEALRLCGSVIQRNPFQMENVRSLRRIGRYALSEGGFYLAGYVVVSLFISQHPSFLLGLVVILLAAGVLYLFCEVLASLLRQAIELKDDNALTI